MILIFRSSYNCIPLSNVRRYSVSFSTQVSVQFGGNAGNFYCDTINPSNSALLIYPLFRCLFILRGLFTRRVELWRANGVEEIKKMSTRAVCIFLKKEKSLGKESRRSWTLCLTLCLIIFEFSPLLHNTKLQYGHA